MNKIAITVLTRGYPSEKNYGQLIKRNNLIYEKIIKQSSYKMDMIIFHEGNLQENHIKFIKENYPSEIIFINLKTTNPKNAFDDKKNILNYELCPPNFLSNNFPLGYKHMCHFWSIDFFDYLKDYNIIIRIDEDCFIEEFDDSILENFLSEKKVFVSPEFQGHDDNRVIVGLEKTLNSFIKDNNLESKKEWTEIVSPYTNIMIINLDFFRRNNIVKTFLKKIDECNCIYSNRWGDLPIWGVILSCFIDIGLYSNTPKIKYFHSSHNKKINY